MSDPSCSTRAARCGVLILLLASGMAPVAASGEPSVLHRWLDGRHPARFDADGVSVSAAPQLGAEPWHVTLRLVGVGREDQLLPPRSAFPAQHAGRIEYARGPLLEWWQVDERGFEQGYVWTHPPRAGGRGWVTMRLDVAGDLRPTVSSDGTQVRFRPVGGHAVLAYRGLQAWDASGRLLRSTIEATADGRGLLLLVDDRGASYPISIDPLLTDQIAELHAAGAASKDEYGSAVSVSGDTVVVGAPRRDGSSSNEGSVYVLERDLGGPDAWGQAKRIDVAAPEANDRFGTAVAVSGDTLAAGEPGDSSLGKNSGAAAIYGRDAGGAGNWGLVKRLVPTGGDKNDEFGSALALEGDLLAVGAPKDREGKVFLHARDQGGADQWGLVAVLQGSGSSNGDRFGAALALSGDLLAVGAYNSDDVAKNAGAVFLFQRDLGGPDAWGEVARLVAPDGMEADLFGYQVSLSGTTLAVGAPRADPFGAASGKAYLFERDFGGPAAWGLFKTLVGEEPSSGDQFGSSIAVRGGSLVVGQLGADSFANNGGSAEVYSRNLGGAGNWGFVSRLGADDAANGDRFATALFLDETTLVVGAPLSDDDGNSSGSAYVYLLDVGSPPPPSSQDVVLLDDGAAHLPVGTGSDTRRIEWVDLDADGDLDLFELNYDGPVGNLVQQNDGAGAFTTHEMLTDPTNALLGIDLSVPSDGVPEALPAKGVAFGDWDGDGDADAYVGTGPTAGLPNRNWFLENRSLQGSPGMFVVHDPGNRIDADLDHTYDARFADLNIDGFVDLVVVNRNEAGRLYMNEGSALLGQFRPIADGANSPVPAIAAMAADNPLADPADLFGSRALEIGDLDDDGDPDVFVVNAGSGPQPNQVFVNQGGAQAGQAGDMLRLQDDDAVDVLGTSYGLDLGDLDNDGDLDAFVVNRNEVDFLLRNDTTAGGDPSFTRIVGTAVDLDQAGYLDTPVYGDGYDCALADLEGDGDLDIVVVNRVQRNLVYLATTSAPTLLDDPAAAYVRITDGSLQQDRGNTRAVAVADIDVYGALGRQGVPELALANSDAGANRYYQNHGAHIEILGGATSQGDTVPVLFAEGRLTETTDVALRVRFAQPGTAGLMVVGLTPGAVPFNGGVLVPSFDVTIPFATDGAGAVDVPMDITGAGLLPGTPLWFQAQAGDDGMLGQPGGAFSLTNALVIVIE